MSTLETKTKTAQLPGCVFCQKSNCNWNGAPMIKDAIENHLFQPYGCNSGKSSYDAKIVKIITKLT